MVMVDDRNLVLCRLAVFQRDQDLIDTWFPVGMRYDRMGIEPFICFPKIPGAQLVPRMQYLEFHDLIDPGCIRCNDDWQRVRALIYSGRVFYYDLEARFVLVVDQ